MICGGGEFQDVTSRSDSSCGRIKPLSNDHWTMTKMPQPRVMVEGVNLLDGSILWLNGAQTGAQGFGIADNPTYDLLSYHPHNDTFEVVATSTIARLYHSVALLLMDGTVLVAGSNPNEMPVWSNETNSNQSTKYPTELRVEIFTPWYLQNGRAEKRPFNIRMSTNMLSPGDTFAVKFENATSVELLEVVLYTGGFVTHCVHMGQQMYFLDVEVKKEGAELIVLETSIPKVKMAPGPYFVYVLANGIPGIAQPVMVEKN